MGRKSAGRLGQRAQDPAVVSFQSQELAGARPSPRTVSECLRAGRVRGLKRGSSTRRGRDRQPRMSVRSVAGHLRRVPDDARELEYTPEDQALLEEGGAIA